LLKFHCGIPGRFGSQMLRHGVVPARCQQPADVLDHDQAGPQDADGMLHLEPYPGACPGPQARTGTGLGHVLAWKTGSQHVDRLYCCPVHGGDVAEVQHAREPVSQDRGGVGVVISNPGEVCPAEDGAYGHA
jgi:hypothetical protein